jgi:hypothetical protein
MAEIAAKLDWMRRVLGVDPSGPTVEAVAPIAIWIAAKDEIDHRLSALARTLRQFGDERCNRVAEFGLYAVTEDGETVGLTRALLDFDRGAPERRTAAAEALRSAVDRYRSSLAANPIAQLLDDNPFGVEIGLIGTLDGALRQISAALG